MVENKKLEKPTNKYSKSKLFNYALLGSCIFFFLRLLIYQQFPEKTVFVIHFAIIVIRFLYNNLNFDHKILKV